MASTAHVTHNSGAIEWYTPPEIIAVARRVMGSIDLDPASTPEANTVVQATTYFTIDDDGLRQTWRGNIWLNPPYRHPDIDNFITKLISEPIDQACVLTNNATETSWYQALIAHAHAVCLIRKRLRFWQPGRKTASPLQGQTVAYIGPRVDLFREEFSTIGCVLLVPQKQGKDPANQRA